MNRTKLDDKKYCRRLYEEVLKQYSERGLYDRLSFTKSEKDILIVLLQKAKPNLELKWVRRLVLSDVKRLEKSGWEELEAKERR